MNFVVVNLQHKLEILPIRKVVADSVETNGKYFQNQL